MTLINDKNAIPLDDPITGKEFLLGSDVGGETRNFEIDDIVSYVSSVIGVGEGGADLDSIRVGSRVVGATIGGSGVVDDDISKAVNRSTNGTFSVLDREVLFLVAN